MGGYPMQMQQQAAPEAPDKSTLAQLEHLLVRFKELHKNTNVPVVAGYLSNAELYLRAQDVNNAAIYLSVSF